MTTNWEGVTRPGDFHEDFRQLRQALADAAANYDWKNVLAIIETNNAGHDLINSWRLGGKSFFTPLHQAAHAGAPIEVVRRLIELGAWRTLQSANGERPVDVAERKGHEHLREILEPVLKHRVPLGVLLSIQAHFHAVIRGRIDDTLPGHALRLPLLEPLLELDDAQMWFSVPGMYGGFHYRLQAFGAKALLVSESWCRVSEGSGERHEINARGSRLVDEGFV